MIVFATVLPTDFFQDYSDVVVVGLKQPDAADSANVVRANNIDTDPENIAEANDTDSYDHLDRKPATTDGNVVAPTPSTLG